MKMLTRRSTDLRYYDQAVLKTISNSHRGRFVRRRKVSLTNGTIMMMLMLAKHPVIEELVEQGVINEERMEEVRTELKRALE